MSLIANRTPAQIAASRANGARSRGPITPAGKATSSQNALRHGLQAVSPLIKGERAEAFDALLADFQLTYSPIGLPEELCVFHMAVAHWKLLRAVHHESDLINDRMERLAPDSPRDLPIRRRVSQAITSIESPQQHAALAGMRFHTTQLERSIDRHYRKLVALQTRRERTGEKEKSPNEPAAA